MQCVRVVVLVLVLIISVIILISCVVVLVIQKDYSNRMKHLDSIKAEPDSQSLPANMQNIDNELQEILQYWRNKLQRFVVTKAVELVYERIQTKQVVAIIGPTGTGKSVYAYKVAFRLSEEHGYKIIPAKQPADITRYFEKGAKQVFVIDDIVGKYDFDEAELVSWETLLHNVLNNNEQIKVILTGRKSFWHPENCERLRFAFVCDLHSNELSLTLSDRRNIYEAYLESSDINALNNKIIEMYPFLPSLCSTYSSKDVGTVEDFFTYPIQFIEEEIDNYKKISPVIYISLAMLAFEENIAKNLSFVNIENEELMKSLFLEFGSQILPSKGLIVSQLEALTDTYVKIDNDCFEFIHVEMKAIVLYCVAKTFMNYVLKYSKKTVIRNQVTLAGITCIRKEQTLPVIKVTPEHEEAYFTRLAGDLIEGQVNCFDILENNQNDFPIFREQFLVFLNSKKRYIKKRNAVGSTVLHVVSSLGYGDYVSYFINFDKGMIDEKDANGNVPLHLACMYGRLDIVELLAVNGRNIHMLNYEEISPFFYACEKNHISVVNFMIKLPDAVGIINKTYTSEHRTVLHIACLKGFTELTRILLNHHANVDVQDKNGLHVTPLHLACRYGKWDTASLLLKFRANVNALDELERTPMYYSCTANHKDIVELLIQNKADIDKSSSNGLTPLHAACEKESIDIVKLLIEKGSDVDAQEKTGERPLHLACRKGNEQTVKLLIDNKASINAKTINKMTPFHEACKNGHPNVVDILLKKNVKYNHKNNQGWTGLFFSCENGNNDVVDMILKYKTDVNRIDKNGVTALHVACTNSHTDIVSTLLKKNAKVNLRDNHGKTPLYISCLNNDIEIVKILCRNGADVNIFGNSELNPITIAQEKGFRLILEELNKVKK